MIEIYAELLFLENLFINYIILLIVSKICSVTKKKKRLILGAASGALYAFVFFIPSIHFLYSTIFKMAASILIVLISFYPIHLKGFIKLMVSFYAVSFAIGGMVLGAIYFTSMSGLIKNNIFYINQLSYFKLIFLVILGYYILKYMSCLFKEKILKKTLKVKITIEIDKKTTCITGLIDTANFLLDPISHTPVIVVEFSALEDFLPEIFKDILKNNEDISTIPDKIYELGWGRRIRFIPYSSLGAETGMLIGVKPDVIYIEKEEQSYQVNNIIIGIYNGKIKIQSDDEYSALLHPDIFKEEACV
ncbi:MAG: sigma-E processing peptidase SpoIIGA [Clostridia bacterium]|nr:sigma-E processing peptidase SpoIIGA [Clostridia bacterium]